MHHMARKYDYGSEVTNIYTITCIDIPRTERNWWMNVYLDHSKASFILCSKTLCELIVDQL